MLEGGKKSLFTEASPIRQDNRRRQVLQEVWQVSQPKSGANQDNVKSSEQGQVKLHLQEVEEVSLQEVGEVHLYKYPDPSNRPELSDENKQRESAKSNIETHLRTDSREVKAQEAEQVVFQEVEPVASLQEVVELPWLAGLVKSKKVGVEEELLLQEVKPVYKGGSQRRRRPTIAKKRHSSLFAGKRDPSREKLPKRKLSGKSHKQLLEEQPSGKSRTVKRQSSKANGGTDKAEQEEVAGEVFTVRKLETRFIPSGSKYSRTSLLEGEETKSRSKSRAVKRSYSATQFNQFQQVRPVYRDPEEKKLGTSLSQRDIGRDYQSLVTKDKILRNQDVQRSVKSESFKLEEGEGTKIIITLTNSPHIQLWQQSPHGGGEPSHYVGSSYHEVEEEEEEFEVGPVIAAVTAEEERKVPDHHLAPPAGQDARKGSYTRVSMRGSRPSSRASLPQGPPTQSPTRVAPASPRVRLYDHPHSDHHRPGECDHLHDAHHRHSDDHRYRTSMPRPVIAAVTAELEDPEEQSAPSPPPPGPPAPPPTQRPRPTPSERPTPSVVTTSYRPPSSYLPASRPVPPLARPRPSYNRSNSSNPSSPSNSVATSNHYHIHVTNPRQLTQVERSSYICQLFYTTTLLRPRDKIANIGKKKGQNGPNLRIHYAKKYTGLKRVHHRRW